MIQSEPTRTVLLVARAAETTAIPVGGFIPKIWATAVGIAVYAILATLAAFYFFRFGRQRWMMVLPISLAAMALGFCVRIPLTSSYYSVGIYAVQQLLLLLAPCGFIAAVYIALTRIAFFLGRDTIGTECLILKPEIIVRLFVLFDVACFLIQAAGGGMSSVASLGKLGEKISIAGLAIQLVSFSCFCFTLLVFGYRLKKLHPDVWARTDGRPGNYKALYLSLIPICIAILIRCIFRIAEFSQGYRGYLVVHEGYFYALDAAPLAAAMLLYILVWPPLVLPFDRIQVEQGLDLEPGRGGLQMYENSSKVATL